MSAPPAIFGGGAALGFAAAVVWLGFVGVPLIVPSYLDLALAYRAEQAKAEALTDQVDATETARKTDHAIATGTVGGERASCEARLADQRAIFAARIAALETYQPESDDAPSCAADGPYLSAAEWMRRAGLSDPD